MRYLIFSTILAAQLWLSAFESRLNNRMGFHYGTPPGYSYSTPIVLASGQAAITILPEVRGALVATETEALVDSIASHLPAIEPLP